MLASWALAAVAELLALLVFVYLGSEGYALKLTLFAPLLFCLAQSIVTDVSYRRADTIALTLATAYATFLLFAAIPEAGIALIGIAVVLYLCLKADGLAFALSVLSLAALSVSMDAFFIALITTMGGISAFVLFLTRRSKNKGLPMVPLVLGPTIIASICLLAYDIAF